MAHRGVVALENAGFLGGTDGASIEEMRRHHARFSVLFPMIAGLVACGGSVTGVDNGSSSGGSSSGAASSSGGSSSSSGGASTGSCVFGRKPAGLCSKGALAQSAPDALGAFFAEAAFLEAASVFAFERLEEELRMLGAPLELVDAARASREDEVRHARMTKKLAKRFGATVAEPSVAETAPRSAYEIALENAVEGCVRETYAAVVAHWQAQASADPQIARTMQAIAEDETKHAALAWDVAAWLEPRLTAEERARIDAARDAAREEMRASLARELDASVVTVAGMPRAADALALFEAVSAAA